ncbi:3-oxoacyl-[acyl-carrier-protein] synthase 3 [Desulfonema limicola]|uniref:3-oxoacyl-[acyl-carrier-protein] synthase 3 n=1 Tax=Desulfonema limicola TaxID=45656 RepID=A0A975GEM9_9BACT|nr:beta-ketoacyl-ACP synthase III [Desulfonema limicola]QTA78358.1 3-oxoacyl-[acyl-carrier-protein] synthase 3 [Desulfonema limicola]
MIKAYIRAVGMYVPENVVKNEELPRELNTSDEWIRQRTGVFERRYASPGDRTSDLAKRAVDNMLERGEVLADEIDCIIFATLSPDFFFPGAGVFLQEKLGWADRHIPCYDIRQQCSGFVYGLQMAQAFVQTGIYKNVLLAGAEIHSNALDFSERGRAVTVLFGDGAGVLVVSPSKDSKSEILSVEIHADGAGALNGIHMKLHDIGQRPVIYYDPSDFNANADLYPDMPASRNLFANAVRRMTEVSLSLLARLNLSVSDIDWVVPHQANIRINKSVVEHLGISDDKVLYNVHKYGNTTAATIPLLLAEYSENNTIKRGDLLLTPAFGSGFTWGAALIRY